MARSANKGRDRNFDTDEMNLTYNLDLPLPKSAGCETRKTTRFKLAKDVDQFCIEPKKPANKTAARSAGLGAHVSWICESLLQPGVDIVQLRNARRSASLTIAGALRFARDEATEPEIETIRYISPVGDYSTHPRTRTHIQSRLDS